MESQDFLVVAVGTPPADALLLATTHQCVGYYTGIPPIYAAQAQAEGWTLPCVITQSLETGAIIAWKAV